MPRKSGGVEIGVTAGLLAVLAGCATVIPNSDPQAPTYAIKTPPPETLDYLGALQCGGLSWALHAVKHADTVQSDRYSGQKGLFLHWAEA
jgi:hypothetical protein